MEKLTRKEEFVLEKFWEKGPMFVRELLECLPEPRPHINTAATFIRALEEKGYLAHERFGNTYRYYAAVSRNEFKKKTLRGIIRKYFDNSYLGVVSTLMEEEDISVDELKDLIRQVENGSPES